ncbi:MAG: YbjQ family protein, partial [Bacteroidetes bacterium]|nr:YbjQ family protein [Bacteroidota bacterium]
MLIVNTETIAGYRIVESLGLVKGNTIRAKHIGKDLIAGLRQIVGGEIKEYTELLTEARNEAILRMENDAGRRGAEAVSNNHYDIDGLISLWAVLNPEAALERAELLVAIGECGDFSR